MYSFADLAADIVSPEVTFAGSVFKLVLSMLLGAVIGLERKGKGQSAGVRTFSLIAMGATLAMILSIYVPQQYLGLKNGDPGRIAAQVISGIGFLGAGAIIQMKGSVRGLTTAAGIWIVAIIGMAVGLGMYVLAVIASGLILAVLVLVERVEHRLSHGAQSRIIRIKIGEIVTDIEPYREVLAANGVHLSANYVDYDYTTSETRLNLIVLQRDSTDCTALFAQLSALNPTKSISIANQLSL